jgi:hypothetical protein
LENYVFQTSNIEIVNGLKFIFLKDEHQFITKINLSFYANQTTFSVIKTAHNQINSTVDFLI